MTYRYRALLLEPRRAGDTMALVGFLDMLRYDRARVTDVGRDTLGGRPVIAVRLESEVRPAHDRWASFGLYSEDLD